MGSSLGLGGRAACLADVHVRQEWTYEIRAVPLEPDMIKELRSCRSRGWILPKASLEKIVQFPRKTFWEGRHVIFDNTEHDCLSALSMGCQELTTHAFPQVCVGWFTSEEFDNRTSQ